MSGQGTEKVERRLAAILALDVVGFSRMMGADEAGTLRRLKAIRAEIIDPAITGAPGRIVKLMGDGMLVEFDSAVSAVQCAIDVQEQLHRSNEDAPDTEAMTVRIGINLGDVIIEGDDIYGDGVNVAARLESIADVGGIFVSASIQDSAHNKVSAAFEDLGEQQLKNIDHPVRVYRVGVTGAENSTAAKARTGIPGLMSAVAAIVIIVSGFLVWNVMGSKDAGQTASVKTPKAQKQAAPAPAATKPDKPTIAVLPFNNFSDDKDQEYFSDGLTEDLITDISKVSGVRVIARNSTFSYKGQSPEVRAVGKVLGATHVIEGSVRKAGNTVRITVQLIDAADGKHIWAERYDRELKDIFAIQDEVVGRIIAMLSIKLTPDEKVRIASKGTDNVEAHDLLMRGRRQEGFFNKASFVEARELYERALILDPNYAVAYARLSTIHAVNGQFGWVENAKLAYQKSLQLAEKAIQLNDQLPIAHWALGRTLMRPKIAQHSRAIEELEKSVRLDPNFADGYGLLALAYIFTGDAARGNDMIEKAMRTNPLFPFWYYYARGMARYLQGDYVGAVEDETLAAERNLTVFFVRTWLAASLAQAGRIEDAKWQVEEMHGMGFDQTFDQLLKETPLVHVEYREKFIKGLRKAGFK